MTGSTQLPTLPRGDDVPALRTALKGCAEALCGLVSMLAEHHLTKDWAANSLSVRRAAGEAERAQSLLKQPSMAESVEGLVKTVGAVAENVAKLKALREAKG